MLLRHFQHFNHISKVSQKHLYIEIGTNENILKFFKFASVVILNGFNRELRQSFAMKYQCKSTAKTDSIHNLNDFLKID
jgi:hypothetical protein